MYKRARKACFYVDLPDFCAGPFQLRRLPPSGPSFLRFLGRENRALPFCDTGAGAEKTISEAGEIQRVYDVLAKAEAADNTLEPESGTQVTSFRFCLSGGSSFEMAYISHEGKTEELKGKNINYQTTEDVSRLWDDFSDEEETPASVSELPAI